MTRFDDINAIARRLIAAPHRVQLFIVAAPWRDARGPIEWELLISRFESAYNARPGDSVTPYLHRLDRLTPLAVAWTPDLPDRFIAIGLLQSLVGRYWRDGCAGTALPVCEVRVGMRWENEPHWYVQAEPGQKGDESLTAFDVHQRRPS